MTLVGLACRSVRYHWRTHVVTAAGTALATAVLSGALLVGASVRHSLESLALARLGATDVVVEASRFVRAAIADDLAAAGPDVGALVVPLIGLDGIVSHPTTGRRATRVAVYGVDERFWRFHGVGDGGPVGRGAFVSAPLAAELAVAAGEPLLLTVERPAEMPPDTLLGRRDGRARTLRLDVTRVLDAGGVGEFSVRPTQAAVAAVFVPLETLQRQLGVAGRVNLLLAGRAAADPRTFDDPAAISDRLRRVARLEDYGVDVRAVEGAPWVAVEARGGVIDEDLSVATAVAAERLGTGRLPVLAYVANAIRAGGRSIPYSVVAGLDVLHHGGAPSAEPIQPAPRAPPPIWLNAWAARDLDVKAGARVVLDYYVWSDEHGLSESSSEFVLAGVVPTAGVGADRQLVPAYPGVTDQLRMSDWDPPFPIDLRRIRDRDERYWQHYGTAPKALVDLETARRLWATRHGSATSVRLGRPPGPPPDVHAAARAVLEVLTELHAGVGTVRSARAEALAAARGTTDFGEYFLYFTGFVTMAALLLTGLMFRFCAEQRLREVGLLRAVGFRASTVRRLLAAEGWLLAAGGAVVGSVAALAWAEAVLAALRTWWFDAVGTEQIALHVSLPPLLAGGLAGASVGGLVMWAAIARIASIEPRTLMEATSLTAAGEDAGGHDRRTAARAGRGAWVLGVAAALVSVLAWAGVVSPVTGFFGAGSLALLAGILAGAAVFSRPARRPLPPPGPWAVARLGARTTRQRPGRSVAALALIAFATFTIVALGGFRRDGGSAAPPGAGGYALVGELVLPLLHDPGTEEGREALGLSADDPAVRGARFTRLRLRAGDEASCLTLYRPVQPRLAGVPDALVQANRFPFAASLAATTEQRANPWRLLRERFDDGAVPVVGDANSLTYVFGLGLGDTLTVTAANGQPATLRVVGLLADSIFQSELLLDEAQFLRLFPDEGGDRLLLAEADEARLAPLAAWLERGLADHGLDVQRTADRLAAYHRVENAYLSAFQSLGVLGLLLGTCGVGLSVLRGVQERRRDVGLLLAVGFRRGQLALMVVAETALLASAGAGLGTTCALLATAPALAVHGRSGALLQWGLLPLLVVLVALASATAAVVATSRVRVPEALGRDR